MEGHCAGCTCALGKTEPARVPRACVRWLRHYGEGVTVEQIAADDGVSASTIRNEIIGINAEIGRSIARRGTRTGGGPFDGLRSNGVIHASGLSLTTVAVK